MEHFHTEAIHFDDLDFSTDFEPLRQQELHHAPFYMGLVLLPDLCGLSSWQSNR
jgi:hypothetical protein